MPDKQFLKLKYRYIFKKRLNLKNPRTFNEKLQWLKLNDRQEIYHRLVDKYEVKRIVADIIGEEHVTPALDVFDSFDDIDFRRLPARFVLKCTHDSGGCFICKDKTQFNAEETKRKINRRLRTDFFTFGREWPYKGIKRRILVEEYLEDEPNKELKDYKVYCFNGVAKIIQLDCNRFTKYRKNLYDLNWNLLPVIYNRPRNIDEHFAKPDQLGEMLQYAEVLSRGIPFVRCDFYIVNNVVLFGEMTFYPM